MAKPRCEWPVGQSIREMDDWMTVQNQLDFYEVAEDILKQLRMIGDQASSVRK
jgi:hypothetical protein